MVDGIGPIPGSMFGPLGLEVNDLKNSQFDWKTVNKGKRSRKSVTRNSNGLSKLLLLPRVSPVRVVDFSGSDSEKYADTSVWPHSSNESLCVPLKKRRHILWAPSPSPPSCASLLNTDQLSPQHQPPFDDFSGIALLAATACSNNMEEPDNAKGGDMESPSSILGRCHTLVSSMQSGDSVSFSCSAQKDVLFLDDKKRQCFPEASYANQIADDDIPFGATNFVSSEVDTLHRDRDQDLYTLMEACKKNEASSDCIPKEKIHRNDEEYAPTDFDCKSNVNDVKHMLPKPSNDCGSSLRCTMPKYSEQHQMGILEVTGGSENSERKNDIQMKEERFEKAFALPENGMTFGEGMIREIVETSGTKSEGIVTSDKGLVSDTDTEVRTVCNLQESIKTNVYNDGSNKLVDAYENEDRVQLDSSTKNIYKLQMDYDSPYEDGELRGSILHSCMQNELEDGEHDHIDYEVNGRVDDDDLDSAHYPGPEGGSQATEKSLGINSLLLDDSIEIIETTEGKNVPIPVDELASPMVVVGKQDSTSGKRNCPFDIAVSRMEEIGSKVISEKWKSSCTEEGGWHTSGRFGKVDISRPERENKSPDRHVTKITGYGSSLHKYRQTESDRLDSRHVNNHFRCSRGGNVHRPPRYQTGDYIGRFSQENYQPEGIRQPLSQRRSPIRRFDFLRGANTKVANIRSSRRERSFENNCSGGYFREEYDNKLVVDDVERSAYTRRVDRMRGSFQKYKEELVLSSPRGQFLHTPPPHGNRFVRETIFPTHPTTRHQKSPTDMFRQDQRLSDTRTLSRRFHVASNRDEELDEHCSNNGRRTYGMRYSDKRRSRFEIRDNFEEDGNYDTGRKDYYYQRGHYGESSLSPSSHRSRWANESNFVSSSSPSRYTRSPMGGGAFRQQTERLVGPIGLSGGQRRKSNDYSTTRNTTRYVE